VGDETTVGDQATSDETASDETRRLGAELRGAIAQVYSRFRSVRPNGEIGDAALWALTQLDKRGPMALTELSMTAHVTPGSMSQTVNRLTRGGYVVRSRDPGDGRRVLFTATPLGRELAADTRSRRHGWFNAHLEALDPADRETLSRAAAILRVIAES
jgi:DNA-binding MarR family transcriptional regulator